MESLKEGLKGSIDKIPQFHRVFLEEIQKRGRISELGLLFRYKLRAGGFLPLKKFREDISLGLRMFLKGKLKLGLSVMEGQREVEGIFKKVHLSKGKR